MLDYFFGSTCKIIFEPFAVAFLLWCVLSIFFFRKKNKTLFWIITGSILFMLAWRLGGHSLMLSGRYSSVFIFPAVIFAACFCVKAPVFFRWLFKKLHWDFPYQRTLCRLLGAAAFIGLSVGCVLKTLRYNPYADCEKKIVRIYLEHSKGKGVLYDLTGERNRLAWYAQKKPEEVGSWEIPEKAPFLSSLRERVDSLINLADRIYLVFVRKKGDVEPVAENLKLTPAHGSWEIIGRSFKSKRKKEEVLLALYKPLQPNIREWKGDVSDRMPPGNICTNGSFEKLLTGKPLLDRQKAYIKNQIKGYEDLTKKKLPVLWNLSLGKWNNTKPPEFYLTEKNPIAGKYSLQIDSRSLFPGYFNYYYLDKRCRYTVYVRGEGEKISRVVVYTLSRNLKLKKYKIFVRHEFWLEPGKTYRLHGEIPVETFPEGFRNFCLCFNVIGFVTMDQVSLVPY